MMPLEIIRASVILMYFDELYILFNFCDLIPITCLCYNSVNRNLNGDYKKIIWCWQKTKYILSLTEWNLDMSNFTHNKEIVFGVINDVERSIFGECCNAHQIATNKPVIEGLVLRLHFPATNSIAQQGSMYYVDLFFVITDRGPI